jgi:signal transduction histidine kinase/ActR/RegA family two-component response regulator
VKTAARSSAPDGEPPGDVDPAVAEWERLRLENEQLRREREALYAQLQSLQGDVRMDRATRRAALNLMEDALNARHVAQRENDERRRVEQELRVADRRKDEFLALLAHELRNPLAPIRNALHLLRLTSARDSGSERLVGIMERQVNLMVRLVDDLMDMSRISSGKIELRRQLIDAGSVVRGGVETSRPIIEAAGHELTVEVPSEPVMLDGDPIRLTQIVANLLNNAAKYSGAGTRIAVSVVRSGDRATVTVRDAGIGIPPDMLVRVFEPFVQIRGNQGHQGGLGIGLTLVRTLAEMHGGAVEAHSPGVGQGSEFVVTLPLANADAAARTGADATDAEALPLLLDVLVVDDNRDAADSLAALLVELGCEVRVAYDGPGALAAFDAIGPDVLFLDLGMPHLDGYEVARRIRQRAPPHEAMLVALTGWGQQADRDRTRAAGFDHHMVKPADIQTLKTWLADARDRLARASPEQDAAGA